MTTPPVYDLFAACMSLDPRVARIITGSAGPTPGPATAPLAGPGVVTGEVPGEGSGPSPDNRTIEEVLQSILTIAARIDRSKP